MEKETRKQKIKRLLAYSKKRREASNKRFWKSMKNVTRIKYEGEAYSETGIGAKCGDWVKVRPCGEKYNNKTYLGILIGEIPLYQGANIKRGRKTLNIWRGGFNPMIYIPDTKSVVFGCGSWWSTIESPEDLKEIKDIDIDNVWYVKALKELS